MKYSNYYVASFDTVIKLVVEGSIDFQNKLINDIFWIEFIPGFDIGKQTTAQTTWQIIEASELKYDFSKRKIWTNTQTIKRAIVIIEASFEHLRQQEAIYTLHGSAITNDECAVAFIGNLSGIGKTSLAAFAAGNFWEWVADDKFSITNQYLIGGTTNLLNDEKTHRASNRQTPKPLPKKLPLKLIVQPILTHESGLTTFTMDREKSIWVLYDEVTRDIRQVNGIIHRTLPTVKSLDNRTIERLRIRAVEDLAANTPVVYMRGSKEMILNEINSIVAVN